MPPIRLDLVRQLADGKTEKKYSAYDGDITQHTLANLRTHLSKDASILDGKDRFKDPGEDKDLDLSAESLFTLDEIINGGGNETGAKIRQPITIFTAAYIAEKNAPAPPPVVQPAPDPIIPLNVIRKPSGIGGKDKIIKILKSELYAMKLETLAEKLVSRGFILEGDLFVEQGTVIDKDRAVGRQVSEILETLDDKYSIELLSKTEAAKSIENDKWRDYVPAIKAADFKVDLTAPTLTDYTFAKDQTIEEKDGFGSIAIKLPASAKARQLSDMTEAERERLLINCRLYPRKGDDATCAALAMRDDIEFCGSNVITCKTIRLESSQLSRQDTVNFSYSEEISKWQTYMVEASKLGVSVPLTFGLNAGGGHSTTKQVFAKGVTAHLSKVLSLPKAEVILEGVELAKIFVDAVSAAVAQKSGLQLMKVLGKYGHFVATHFVLGGKIVCTSSKTLTDQNERDELGWSFNASASGAFEAQGVPVELGAGGGVTKGEKSDITKIDQRYELVVKTTGGFGEGSSSETAKLGGDWLHTISTQPLTWRVIGFKDEEIRPTLDYLTDETLKANAKTLLREYFVSQLVLRKSEAVGGSGGDVWSEQSLAKFNNRIAGYNALFGNNIDSIRFTYEDRGNGKQTTGEWHGWSKETEHPYTFGNNDEVVGIEVGWETSVDHIFIYTQSGANTSDAKGKKGGAVYSHLFKEPRIRGFHGRAGKFLDALGVYYYDLSNDLGGIHKSALLSLERYLFSPR
ncbi:jacalin-like lectin protein,MAC/perforin domain-containing protein [Terriglobus roseus DSM 18391]|uniref:Jacalin-like lectin protein,MAC/perforin domain-containing protein n=1 Tax=Terriglobus roseus (strain DSM 18391 / NRRL B-41598 / KBS 63) TaxID=926566 RepID=I3ZIY8_TERRK|nr:jacalin-like lectin [Terriglobus roseus]AFL89206.1 jacalin-like lectin protein,MAC/perforin domain-containing protein [Terriglobus roseus DSM 18391]